MSKQRYIIEGEWTGYRSSQRRVVHRDVTTNDKLAEWVRAHSYISYTDGTGLVLSVREANKYERVRRIDGYSKLIADCYYAGVTSVRDLDRSAA